MTEQWVSQAFAAGVTPFEFQYPFDEKIQSFIIKEVGDWIVSVTPMIFNNRVLLTHRDEYPDTWTAGWCYDKGAAAFLAALAWDVETEREPVGYRKVAGDQR